MNEKVALGAVCRRGRVLLVKRRKDKELVWSLPGGKIDADETDEMAIIRKIRHETGVTAVAVKKLGERVHPSSGRPMGYWECKYHSGVLEPTAKDIEGVAWHTAEEAFEVLGEQLFEPVKDFLTTCSV